MHFSNSKKDNLLSLIFASFITLYIILGLLLVFNIPFTYPYGAPDELIHIPLAEYIAKHHHWAYWDSDEIVRAPIGVSYTTGSSIIYWLHGITFEIFNQHRIGAFIASLFYFLISILLYLKNRLAGFFLLASYLPQTLFIFSYVNSDSGTILTALMFGLSLALFIDNPKSIKRLYFLFFMAGFTITARQHLWPLSFTSMILILFFYRSIIFSLPIKKIVTALFLTMLPMSWWFYTSYTYNNHDIIGVFTSSLSVIKFGNPDFSPEVLSRSWDDIILFDFIKSTAISFYGVWGWLSIGLSLKSYIIAISLLFALYISVLKYFTREIIFVFLLLIIINIGFMFIYSINFDYQAQGRYLFPSFYIIVGFISCSLLLKKIHSKISIFLAIVLIAFNILFSLKLLSIQYY